MALNPLTDEFWQNESAELWAALSPLVMRALLAGAEGGVSLLPGELVPLVDWDIFNRAALAYLREYRLSTVAGIASTTREQTIAAIEAWVQEGAPLPVLQDRLAPIFGKRRADMIAVTEVTRIVARGNLELWGSTGVVAGKRWMTAVDDRVCPICQPLHGQLVEIDRGWTFDGDALANNRDLARALQNRPTTFLSPPAHVNCFPGDALVLPIDRIAAGSKRWYEGDLVIIETPEHELAVTPNHPILTRDFGFVAAGDLQQGQHIAQYGMAEWESARFGINNQQMVSRIEDVFASLGFTDFRMPTSAPDFHNEGTNSQIAVIRSNGNVMDGLQTFGLDPFSERQLFGADIIADTTFPPLGTTNQFRPGYFPAPSGIMSSLDLPSPLSCGHSLPLGFLGGALASGRDTRFKQTLPEGPTVDPSFFGELVLRFPGLITSQEVIEIRNMDFSGHVYNLQTGSGLIVADGIITHNCRCWLQPAVSEDLLREQIGDILAGAFFARMERDNLEVVRV